MGKSILKFNIVILLLMFFALSILNSQPCTYTDTYNFTGSVQTWTVPDGVTEITVDMYGAGGGQSAQNNVVQTIHFPGEGGRLEAVFPVTPGQVLNIYVGGKGEDAGNMTNTIGGWNGGGNAFNGFGQYYGGAGGGASDIRIDGTDLADRVLVAGAGAGAAHHYFAGGDHGGNGGDLIGHDGMSGGGANGYYGLGGTQAAGGAGGIYAPYVNGEPGALGIGGDGGSDNSGGGGGGGYYGGGGGCWAGGGGGSSYTDAAVVTFTHTQSGNPDDGIVLITYFLDDEDPTITCIGDQEVDADATGYYTVTGTEFDPTEYDDVCSDVTIENDYNNSETLAGDDIPPGTYTIIWTATDTYDNTATCSFELIVNAHVGIDRGYTGILIYPNPSDGIYKVSNAVGYLLTVSDLTGKIIDQYKINDKHFLLDINDQETGIYFIKLQNKESVKTIKIIKK